ncbi:MAG TPA: hypothetical protein VFK54_06900 [Candidatus Limnocylindrales bacterium]|nr:hypothetical protein [Candidatus Limnocylindrales bacterium]
MVRRHRRFALRDVTLEGRAVGGATIDAWEDDAGNERWAARAMVPAAPGPSDGVLAGTTRDGHRLSGQVRVGANQVGAKGARVVLVDLYGNGPLIDETGGRHGG